MNICPYCHHKNQVGEFFCERCGAALVAQPQSAAGAQVPPASWVDADVVICPNCSFHNQPGAIYCVSCNYALPVDGYTPPVERPNLKEPAHGAADRDAETAVLQYDQPVLYVQRAEEPFLLSTERTTVLGRFSPDARVQLTIDLTPYQAYELGVSRLHASISYDGSSFILQDLGSTNGTTLNTKPVVPNSGYVLHSGDEICLGKLVCRIYF
jgi:hypothetical protein